MDPIRELFSLLAEYSLPVVALMVVSAALLYVMKLVIDRAVEAQFDRHQKELELRLERRSEFEQRVLLDRYKLVCEFAQRLSRIVTDLNRHRHGRTVEGLYSENELVPLTAVFEDLTSMQFQLSRRFHGLFYEQAQVVLAMANTKTEDGIRAAQDRYVGNLAELQKGVEEEFRMEGLSW